MKNFFTIGLLFVIVLFGLTISVHAATFSSSKSPTISEPINDDLFASGNSILINAPVTGDVFAIGETVMVRKPVSRSLVVAASTVTVDEGIGHTGWIGGQNIVIRGEVGHDLWVAGQAVTIDPSTDIKGQLRVFASTIVIEGTIDGKAIIDGVSITTSANYGSDVEFRAPNIDFNGGTINGNLVYKRQTALDHFGTTKIVGKTTHELLEPSNSLNVRIRQSLFSILSMLIVGSLLIMFLRKKLEKIIDLVLTNWKTSFLSGLATLVVVPLVAIGLVYTVVGIPLALIIMAAYIVLIYISGIIGYFVIGKWLFKRFNRKISSLWWPFIAALVVIGALQLIPTVDWVAMMIFGIATFVPSVGATIHWYKQLLSDS